jgi:tetratricopeptide (TPR) repeat protein
LRQYPTALEELCRADELSPGFFLVQTEIHLCEGALSGTISEEVLALLRRLQQLTDSGGAQSRAAIDLSRRMIALAPSVALGHFYLGKALLQADPQEAAAELRRCLELDPDDTTAIDAKQHLGLLLWREGDTSAARALWQEVLEQYPGNPHTKWSEFLLSQGGLAAMSLDAHNCVRDE